MKIFVLIATLVISSIQLYAQNVISPYLDVQGPLYARENINSLNKAANGWIPWAIRNTSQSETKIELLNILSINAGGGDVGIGTNSPSNLQGWSKVLDVRGGDHTKILSTTTNATYRTGMYAHTTWAGDSGVSR